MSSLLVTMNDDNGNHHQPGRATSIVLAQALYLDLDGAAHKVLGVSNSHPQEECHVLNGLEHDLACLLPAWAPLLLPWCALARTPHSLSFYSDKLKEPRAYRHHAMSGKP